MYGLDPIGITYFVCIVSLRHRHIITPNHHLANNNKIMSPLFRTPFFEQKGEEKEIFIKSLVLATFYRI